MLSLVEVTAAFHISYAEATQVVLSCLVVASDNADLQSVILHDPVSTEETWLSHPSRLAHHGLHMGISSASVPGTSVVLPVWAKTAVQATLVSL